MLVRINLCLRHVHRAATPAPWQAASGFGAPSFHPLESSPPTPAAIFHPPSSIASALLVSPTAAVEAQIHDTPLRQARAVITQQCKALSKHVAALALHHLHLACSFASTLGFTNASRPSIQPTTSLPSRLGSNNPLPLCSTSLFPYPLPRYPGIKFPYTPAPRELRPIFRPLAKRLHVTIILPALIPFYRSYLDLILLYHFLSFSPSPTSTCCIPDPTPSPCKLYPQSHQRNSIDTPHHTTWFNPSLARTRQLGLVELPALLPGHLLTGSL